MSANTNFYLIKLKPFVHGKPILLMLKQNQYTNKINIKKRNKNMKEEKT